MTHEEEQNLIHAVAGLAQSVHALLALHIELGERRARTDEEIVNLLKQISRKH
jgi:hypothetical protein